MGRNGMGARWRRLAICGLIAGVLYLPALGSPALWEPDEGRYAEIAREMLRSADYITPRDDWVRYFEKPPLMYWATAASIRALGENEFALRLPPALFTVGEVVVTCAIADQMFGAGAGMLAALALALSPLVWGFAMFLTLDPALAFFVTAALGSFWAAAAIPGFRSRAARRWLMAAAAIIAMGTLTKGPVALVIFGSVALIYMLIEKRLRELAAIPWFECILVYAAIVVPWFAAVAALNPEFLGYFFLHEHLQRYLANTEHGWGPWFLFAVAAAGSWPWLYFVPLGIARFSGGRAARDARESSAIRFLSIWFLFVLIFFSIPRSKLGTYILPAMPPLAIVAGYGLSTLAELDRERLRRLLRWFAIVNVIVAAGCIVALAIARAALGGALVLDWILAAGCLGIGAVAAFAIGMRGSVRGAIAAIAIAVGFAAGAGMKARIDAQPLVSYRELASAIRPALESGCVLASYGHLEQSLPFYTHTREVMVDYLGELGAGRASPDGAKSFMDKADLPGVWSGSSCVVLVANRRDYDALAQMLKPAPAIIACEGKKVALYNRPAPGAAAQYDCR
ncbi:MAG: phospholipid carrier-dependent glycosyltransferase [Candidatus Binatales bacterium]